MDLKKVHEVNREEVNRILDKINAHGMSALTPQERMFLSNFAPADDGRRQSVSPGSFRVTSRSFA